MGAESFDGIVEASTNKEAQEKYSQMAPSSGYILETIYYVSKPNVRFLDMPSTQTLKTYEDVVDYLLSNTSKWDTDTVMLKVAPKTYIYAVVLPS
jgi:hypothetical protein